MRVYFDTNEMHDELLDLKVDARLVAQSSSYVEDLAISYGVQPVDIAFPTPFRISQIALYYTMMTAALETTLMASDGEQDGADAYELKRRLYKGLLDELLEGLSADTFLNGQTRVLKMPASVKMFRS